MPKIHSPVCAMQKSRYVAQGRPTQPVGRVIVIIESKRVLPHLPDHVRRSVLRVAVYNSNFPDFSFGDLSQQDKG